MYTEVGLEVDTQVSIGEIHLFEKHLNTTINVFSSEGHRYPINLENQFENQVYLFLHNNHYIVITSPEAFYVFKKTINFVMVVNGVFRNQLIFAILLVSL